MSCESWKEMLIDRVADELDEEAAILLEQHLADCRACAQEEERLREIARAARASRPFVPGPSLEARLVESMRRMASPERAHPAREAVSLLRRLQRLFPAAARRPVPAYAAAALTLAALAGGFFAGWEGSTSPPSIAVPEPAWTSPEPVPQESDGFPHAGEPPPSGEALAQLSPRDLTVSGLRFATAPSDAVLPAGPIFPDSL